MNVLILNLNNNVSPLFYLNKKIYIKRMTLTAETLLAEGNHRAKVASKRAYIHLVGLGLGVWRVHNEQIEVFGRIFVEAVQRMKPGNVADLDFSWVFHQKEGDRPRISLTDGSEVSSGDTIPGTSTVCHISQREPWSPLKEEESSGKLIVATWAWDGMSLVGNEYWAGSLQSSSDPAAACCTQIQAAKQQKFQ